MRINFRESISLRGQEFDQLKPRPGEIWELSRLVRSPLEFSGEEQRKLYSDAAQRFLEGKSLPHYVMIVNESEPPVEPEEEWRIISVMLLSEETSFLSNVDLLIPSHVSGVGRDLLAQTWHVLPMLTCNLSHVIGRLSRQVYEVLLTVGDYYHGLVDEAPPIQEIHSLGLRVGTVSAEQPDIQAFHQLEEAWADVLTVPVAAYHTYLKAVNLTEVILDGALQLEQEFSEVAVEVLDTADTNVASFAPSKTRVFLSQWFQNVCEAGWQTVEEILSTLGTTEANLAYGFRTPDRDDDDNRRQAAVSLEKIDASNWADGVRRAKVIDLELLLYSYRVVLVVTLMPEADRRTNINLRPYPTGGQTYLPPNLQMIVLDESGETILEAQSRSTDNSMQLGFRGDCGDCFSIKVAFGDASFTQDFVI